MRIFRKKILRFPVFFGLSCDQADDSAGIALDGKPDFAVCAAVGEVERAALRIGDGRNENGGACDIRREIIIEEVFRISDAVRFRQARFSGTQAHPRFHRHTGTRVNDRIGIPAGKQYLSLTAAHRTAQYSRTPHNFFRRCQRIALPDCGNFLGFRWRIWNPGHLIPLVEVIKSDVTEEWVMDETMELMTVCGKKPVYCKKDVPGFVANRLQHALWREAFYMVENGIADAKTVDDACKYGPGLRWPVMGPMENSDLVSIQLSKNIHDYILPHLADNHEPSKCLAEMLERGDNGFKTGKGWQEWTPEQIQASNTGLREYLIDYIAKQKKA